MKNISLTFLFIAILVSLTVLANPTSQPYATSTGPEADMFGNGYPINHTSSIISLANHTDFGNVNVCDDATITRTYTLKNTGSDTLFLTSVPMVIVTGLAAADFTVTQPSDNIVLAGSFITYQVTFNPSATGFRNARITVANNDLNESGYYFAIRGKGIACE